MTCCGDAGIVPAMTGPHATPDNLGAPVLSFGVFADPHYSAKLYGNRDCAGPGSRYPKPEIPFRGVAGVAVAGDELFVADDLNKRIVRCVLAYETTEEVRLP